MSVTVERCVNGCGNEVATEAGECVRCRDKWTCTAIIPDRLHGGTRKCCVMGSEVVVRDGATYCPRHIPQTEGTSHGDN